MKPEECNEKTCRYNQKGLWSEKARQAICAFCVDQNNYDPITSEDQTRLEKFTANFDVPKKRKMEFVEITAPIY